MAMQILLEAILIVCFWVIRQVFISLQQCLWFFNGTSKRLQHLRDPDQYPQSAQLMRVWLKYSFDPLPTLNSVKSFVLIHEEFVHPEYVLKAEVSLYCMTQTEAVFVEAPPGVEVWKKKFGAFHKLAQYNYAKKIIIMPLSSFYKLSQTVGKPKEKLIFIDHVPRSGSTLLCSIFEKSGQCVSFCEPNAFYDMSVFQDFTDPDEARTFLESQINLLCKPSSTSPKAFVIKLTGFCTSSYKALMNSVLSSYPNTQFFFQYRNGYDCVKSMTKSRAKFKYTQLTDTLLKPFPYFARKVFVKRALSFGPDTPPEVVHVLKKSSDMDVLVCVIRWASITKAYVNLQKELSDEVLAASKYEDLTADPRGSIEAIFQHCGLGKHSVAGALHAFSTDSQAGTYLSSSVIIGDRYRAFDSVWQKDDVKRDVEFLCNAYGITNPNEDLRLPNTVSNK